MSRRRKRKRSANSGSAGEKKQGRPLPEIPVPDSDLLPDSEESASEILEKSKKTEPASGSEERILSDSADSVPKKESRLSDIDDDLELGEDFEISNRQTPIPEKRKEEEETNSTVTSIGLFPEPEEKDTSDPLNYEDSDEADDSEDSHRTVDSPNELGELEELDDELLSPASDEETDSADSDEDELPTEEDESPATQTEDENIESQSDEETHDSESHQQDTWQGRAKAMVSESLANVSIFERITLIVVFLIVGAFLILGVQCQLNQLPQTTDEFQVSFPVKGDQVVIDELSTYWRSPRRSGANADERISDEVSLIPEILVTLSPKSSSGYLRFLFRDENESIIGDPSTVSFKGGRFRDSQSVTVNVSGKTAAVRATTGFTRSGELISYLADDNFVWNIVIFESKDNRDYRELLTVPISPKRFEKK